MFNAQTDDGVDYSDDDDDDHKHLSIDICLSNGHVCV